MAVNTDRTLDWCPPRQRAANEEGLVRTWGRYALHLSGRHARTLWEESGRAMDLSDGMESVPTEQLIERLAGDRLQFRVWSGQRRTDLARTETRIQTLGALCILSERLLGLRPFRAQLHAALAMHEGYAVQMKAGEGKTLATGFGAILQAWSGRPCHVVTANDYLAGRDAESLRPLYEACGLGVAALEPEADERLRRERYGADVLYATGKQLLADYLRDQLALEGADSLLRLRLQALRPAKGPRQPVMRGLYSAIVDEADSVLIDDAMTPLIISVPHQDERLFTAVRMAQQLAEGLELDRDYRVDRAHRYLRFTQRGEQRLDGLCADLPPMWRARERREDLMRQALSAREFFERDRHYMVEEGKVVLLDENTGRAMPGRSWGYGLHQAIEAREGVELTPPTRTMARMSFQRFFGLYHHLSGASGTLGGLELELWSTYRLRTLVVDSRVPSRLRVGARRHYATAAERLRGLVEDAILLHRAGCPVLIGTRRIEDSERVAELLERRGCHFSVLNAKEHAKEAEIIAEAGVAGKITVATNMAGRGTDIKLGPGVATQGGLRVLMFEPHQSRRVDWQLFGRAGRQGDPGEATPFASAEDELILRHTPWPALPLLWLLRSPLKRIDRLRGWLLWSLLPLAQFKAEREGWQRRRNLVKAEKLQSEQLTFTAGHPTKK